MSRPAPDRDVAPVAQRLRIRYAKRGRLRFASHRDFQRALERAVRRARIPIAFSAGFSPHPRISYANAAPTGAASEAEYVEIGVTQPCDPARVAAALEEALPDGFHIVEVVVARTPDFATRLEASIWRIRVPGAPALAAEEAVAAFLAADRVEVDRRTKDGHRTLDARAAVVALGVDAPGGAAEDPARPCAILTAVVRNATPTVRPEDLLTALRLVSGLAGSAPAEAVRISQGPLEVQTASVGDPLAPDREGAAIL